MTEKIPSPYVGPRPFRAGEKLYGRERETHNLLDLLTAERIILLYSPSGAGKSSLIQAALLPGLQAQGFAVLHTVRLNLDAEGGIQPVNRYVYSALLSLEEGQPTGQRLPAEQLAGMTLDGYLKGRASPPGPGDSNRLASSGEGSQNAPAAPASAVGPPSEDAAVSNLTSSGASKDSASPAPPSAVDVGQVSNLTSSAVGPAPVDTADSNLTSSSSVGPAPVDSVDSNLTSSGASEDSPPPAPLDGEGRAVGQRDEALPIVLIFDQFEEVITTDPTNRDAKQVFFNQLGQALRDRSRWALFAIREDYVATLDPFLRPIPTRLSSRYRLDLLEVNGAIQAICEPVRAIGMDFDASAAQKLVDDLRRVQIQQPDGSFQQVEGPYVEPVQLQVVCSKIWQDLPSGDAQITLQDVQSVGDIDQALGAYYDSQIAAVVASSASHPTSPPPPSDASSPNLPQAQRGSQKIEPSLSSAGGGQSVPIPPSPPEGEWRAPRAEGQGGEAVLTERDVRKWFDTRLINPQGIRLQVPLGQNVTEGLPNAAVFAIERTYLIRSEKRGGTTWFELAHDRLIAPIRQSNTQWFAAHLVPLQRQAEVWAQHDRPDGMLLSGQALLDAETWASQHPSELQADERDFLTAAARVRTAAERVQRYTLRIRRLALIATVVGVLAVVVSLLAVWQALEARRQTNISAAREISFAALSSLENDPERAMLLALAAMDRTGGPAHALPSAVDALHRAIQANHLAQTLRGHTARVIAAAYSADGKVATASADLTARIWDPVSGKALVTIHSPTNADLDDVTFSPDGRLLAVGTADGWVRVWSSARGEPRAAFAPPPPISSDGTTNDVWNVAFAADGKSLAAAYEDGFVRVWALNQTKQPLRTFDLGRPAVAVAFSADSLAAGDAYGELTVWDAASGRERYRISAHDDQINSLAFSPDGRLLLSASADHTARVWIAADGQPRPSANLLDSHQDWVYSAIFTPDGSQIVTASADRTIRVWSADTLVEQLRIPISSSQEYEIAISPDGTRVVSASADGTAHIWNILFTANRELSSAFIGDWLNRMVIATDGQQVAVGGPAGVTIWDWPPQGESPRALIPSTTTGSIQSLAYSGQWLATTGDDGWVTLLDAQAKYRSVWSIGVEQDLIPQTSLAFRADGLQLFTGGRDGQVRVWQVSDGALLAALPIPDGVQAGAAVLAVDSAAGAGKTLVAAAYGDGSLAVWDVDAKTALVVLPQVHAETVRALALQPAASAGAAPSLLASVDDGGVLQLTDLDLSARKATPRAPLKKHTGALYALRFSADGQQLATGGVDHTVRLWDAAAGKETQTLSVTGDRIADLAFAPSQIPGQAFLVGMRNGVIGGYLLDPVALARLARARLTRTLTDDECQTYLQQAQCQK